MQPLKTFRKNHTAIVCDPFSYDRKPEIRTFIESEEVARIIEAVKEDFILVLGGDGTMLRAIHAHHAENLPFLGINYGTKGFLLNDRSIVDRMDSFEERSYPLLEVDVRQGNDVRQAVAFNEVQIKNASGGMVDLDFSIGGRVAQNMQGDGLLVVTPAGSTGYNSSAGGPILPHDSGHGILTPLIPWQPRHMRPILYNRRDTIEVTNRTDRPRKLSVYADSVGVIENTTERVSVIVRESDTRIRLLIASGYIEEWDAKIFAEQGMEVL